MSFQMPIWFRNVAFAATVWSDQSSEIPDRFRTELRFSWRKLLLIFSVYRNSCKFGWPHHAPSAERRVLGHEATEQLTE